MERTVTAPQIRIPRRGMRQAARYAGIFAAAAAAGAASLSGHPAPFGLALCIAAPREAAFLCAAGCMLGGFAGLPVQLAVRQAAAALVILTVRLLLGRRALPWAALAGMAVYSLVSQAAAALKAPYSGPFTWLVMDGFVLALALLYREVRPETLLARTAREQLVLLAAWTSLLCTVGGLGAGVPLLYTAAALAVLMLGSLERDSLQPPVWAGSALACLALRQNAAALLAVLAAAWAAPHLAARRRGAAGTYFGLSLLVVFAAPDLAGLARLAGANALAAAAFALLPERWLTVLGQNFVQGDARRARTPAQTLNALAAGLEAVGSGVEALGRASPAAGEDPNSPIEAVCSEVCSGCVQKARCWGAEYDVTQDVLQQFLTGWRESCSARFAPHFACVRQDAVQSTLLRAEKQRVLRRAGRADTGVLRSAVGDQYRAMADGLYGLARTWQPESPQPQLEGRLQSLFGALQLPVRRLEAFRRADGTLQVRVGLRPIRLGSGVPGQLAREAGRVCGQPLCVLSAQEQDGLLELVFSSQPRCRAEIGSASRAFGGVCGDVTEQLTEGACQYLLLCDGMGTGREAALDAKMVALFAARLLRAGFSGSVAARLVNAALLTREPGDRGSTLDVFSLNGMQGTTTLYKAGGSASFLRSAEEVRRLPGGGLPVGSAETVRDELQQLELLPGDWLVLASDGALSGGEEPLVRALRALPDCTAAEAAGLLLNACLENGRPPDDCTVAAVHILPV